MPIDLNPLVRHELYILDYIRPGSRVLDLGCGKGKFDRRLKEKGCSAVGLDIEEENIKEGCDCREASICADIEKDGALQKIEGKFDYILFMDVLEHLKSPEEILPKVKGLLKEDGLIIAHIPNISYWTTRLTILSGEFEYDPRGGIFAVGHIHFFNYRTMKRLFLKAGYAIKHIEPLAFFPGEGFVSRIPLLRIPLLKITEIIKLSFPNLFGRSFVFIVRPVG
jgi:methionine biosynthesis protein MetW